jgi:drug/metabolite transporter (DMT)-like permease
MSIPSVLRLLLLAAIWGGSFLFMRIAVPEFGPMPVVEMRVVLAAVLLWMVARIMRTSESLLPHWRHFLIIGFLNTALPFALFAYAAREISASLLAIANSTAPLFAAVMSVVLLRQRLNPQAWIGLLLGVVGVGLVGIDQMQLPPEGRLAFMAGLGAACSYGCASLYTRYAANTASSSATAQGSMWAASMLALPLLLVSDGVPTALSTITPVAWFSALMLGLVCTGLAYILYFRLIHDEGPVRALSVTFLIPLFGIFWGWLILNEQVTWHMVFGVILVLLGTALTNGLLRWPRAANAQ